MNLETSPSLVAAQNAQKRITASVNAYLILWENDKVLLQLRKNTGYLDDHWSLPAGHVEWGESATEGLVREAKEELGIEIEATDLKFVHMMHRKTNRMNIDIFFDCRSWRGNIENREPEKCGALDFFALNALPVPMADYNKSVLDISDPVEHYSEWGFSEDPSP